MRLLVPLALLPLLTACPTSHKPTAGFCNPDPSLTLTDTDVLDGWGTSIAEHPLMTGSPFTGTLTYAADGTTTEATITTAYRDVVIVGATNSEDPRLACPPDVEFTMDLTFKTADGAFDETLVASLNYVWIDNGTLIAAAWNEAIEGDYAETYDVATRATANSRVDLVHPPDSPLPTRGDVMIDFDAPEDEMGTFDLVGDLTFE